MRSSRPNRARGAALLIMVMIVGLGATWYLVSRLNTESGLAGAAVKARNQRILNTAKAALIGYVAAQAIKAGESRPGALPCPEAPADFNIAASEGTVSYPCSLPIVGRFPWRTLGLDKLVDASGEPLWYAVATGWAGANTVINSDCASPASGMACATGRLTVDGVASDVIALIIAPGPTFSAPATTTGCREWNQIRPTTGTPDSRNYLECENATWPADPTPAYATFVTTKPPIVDPDTKAINPVFNDQVMTITVADIMPAIEAAIAKRIESEILPALQTVYTPSVWGFAGTSPVTSNPVLPFAAEWVDGVTFPRTVTGAGSSNYQGADSKYAGLLPFNQTQGCTTSAENPRCTTTLMAWSSLGAVKVAGSGTIRTDVGVPNVCAWESIDVFACTGAYGTQPLSLSVTVTITNVGMGLRAQDLSKVTCIAVDDQGLGIGQQTIPCSVTSVVLQTNGSAMISVTTSALPDVAASGWNTWALFKIGLNRALIGDHPLLNPEYNAVTGSGARVLSFTNGTSEIQYGQTVTGASSGASGVAIPYRTPGTTWGSDASGLLFFSTVTGGPFQSGESLQVGGSARATASGADLDFGWFARNEWYRLLYYAVSPSNTALNVAAERSCSALPADCLTLTTGTSSSNKSALLILAGRSINGNSRPSPMLADYLEFGNRTGDYEVRTVTGRAANAYPDTGTAANVYAIAAPVTIGRSFQFKAVHANSGASTLAATGVSTANLLNANGTSLSASQIQPGVVSEVTYDGTQFKLYKRPFNDRVMAIGSN